MKILNLLILSFYVICTIPVGGQDSLLLRKHLIAQLSKIRTQVVSQNQKELLNLTFSEDWEESPEMFEVTNSLILEVGFMKEVEGKDDKYIKRKLKTIYQNPWAPIFLDSTRIQEVIVNYDIVDLIQNDVVKSTYPYPLNPNTNLETELSFYNICDGESLAEIGAGAGLFSLILSMVYPRSQVYINDIEEMSISYITHRMNKNQDLIALEKIHIELGSEEQTNLPAKAVDKMIIRKAFHHFTKPEKMLASIRENLTEDGYLFLVEPTKDLNPNRRYCGKIQTRKKIVKTLGKNGFRLLDEKIMGNILLLKFEINES